MMMMFYGYLKLPDHDSMLEAGHLWILTYIITHRYCALFILKNRVNHSNRERSILMIYFATAQSVHPWTGMSLT